MHAVLTVSATDRVTIADKTIASSTRGEAAWVAPNGVIDHYVITATETAGGPPMIFTATSTSTELTNLESGTQYRIDLRACIEERTLRRQNGG